MLIHETAGITDTECRIQLNINSPIGENLKILGGEYSVFLKKEEDGIYMKSFIEKSFEKMLALNPGAFQEIGDYFSLTEKLESSEIHEVMVNLNSIPTVMMHQPFLSNGKMNILFSYRHTVAKDVSNTLLPVVLKNNFVYNIRIRPTKGAMETLLNMNKKRPLTVIRFSIHRDVHAGKKLMDALESSNSLGRLVNDYLEQGQFKIAVISEKPLELLEGIEEIPKMENSYWVRANNPILGKIMEKAASRGIYIDTTYIRPVKRHIQVTQFVPSIRATEYLQILFNTSLEEIQRNDVSVEIASPLTEELIELI